jgi:hypothetical protein
MPCGVVLHMTPKSIRESIVPGDAGDSPEFHIMIVSDDEQAAARATHVCHNLMARFDGSFVYRIVMTTFATLHEPGQFDRSIKMARGADMIFVASRDPLPSTVDRWLNACVREHEDAPFAVADMTRDGAIDARSLQQCIPKARRYGVDVIKEQVRPALHGLAAESRHSCSSRWGINE